MKCLLWALGYAAVTVAAAATPPEVPPFSGGTGGGSLPAGWKQLKLASYKNDTDYVLATEDGVVVLRATSHNAASFLATKVDYDPREFPILSWRWNVVQGIATANTAEQSKEDAPVRVMIAFDGDMSKLSIKDRLEAKAAQSISGVGLPYATLMYIWGGKVALDSITTSTRTARIKMLAVAVDDQGIGQWHSYQRNLVDDFKRAFNEAPGRVTSIEIMTDTDNTGGDAQAYYGDITVSAKP